MSAYSAGLDILGASADVIFGAFDIAEKQRQLNTLKKVPISVAAALLHGGEAAIATARTLGTDKKLPGQTDRDNVFWKLQWHDGALNKATDPNAIYPSGDDLKKWVMQAFIEANAAEEGSNYADAAWDDMWAEVARRLAALPKETLAAVQTVVAESTSSLKWALYIGAAVAAVAGVLAVRSAFK